MGVQWHPLLRIQWWDWGLVKDGCVLWIKGKRSSHFFGIIDHFKDLLWFKISPIRSTCHPQWGETTVQVLSVQVPIVRSGWSWFVILYFHLHDVAAVKQDLLVQKMDLDFASCNVSMEVPTICDDSPQVYITYSSIHFLTVARGMLPNRMSGVIQVLLNGMVFNTSTRGDSAEPGWWQDHWRLSGRERWKVYPKSLRSKRQIWAELAQLLDSLCLLFGWSIIITIRWFLPSFLRASYLKKCWNHDQVLGRLQDGGGNEIFQRWWPSRVIFSFLLWRSRNSNLQQRVLKKASQKGQKLPGSRKFWKEWTDYLEDHCSLASS